MILLSANGITKRFGPEAVLDQASLEVRSGDRVGLVGPNGTGKTTLLKILTGELEPDAGTVVVHERAKIGYLSQHAHFEPQQTLRDVVMSGVEHLRELIADAERIAQAMAEDSGNAQLARKYDQLQHELQQQDAYQLDHRVDRILRGLGFDPNRFDTPASLLSGGQQNRLTLAKLLVGEPDLLLLDEPSNHLDMATTEWLENFLAASSKSLLIVSHDRYFLDKVTNRTLELFHGTVDDYKGNFSAYWQQKAERVEVQRRTYEKQQEEIAKLEDFVRRHHHGQKHAQAEDRRKKLERIEPVPPPRDIVAPKMRFPKAERTGDIVLRGEHLAKSFSMPLFRELTFDVLRAERWGLMGGNGSGKSTLLKCLLGHEQLTEGTVTLGTGVRIGYFDQHLAGLDPDMEAVEAIRPSHKEFNEPQRRDLLARFGMTGDMVFEKIGTLSGGERNRVALAKLAAEDANVLLLDEPTNHLDLWARDGLEQALMAFDGTVILVSHDRYLLNRVADHLLVFEPHRVRVIDGNYDTYQLMTQVQESTEAAEDGERTSKKKKSASQPARRKRKFPYRKVVDIEADIAAQEESQQALHDQLADPEVLRDGRRVKEVQQKLSDCETALEQLYEHWEEASELNG